MNRKRIHNLIERPVLINGLVLFRISFGFFSFIYLITNLLSDGFAEHFFLTTIYFSLTDIIPISPLDKVGIYALHFIMLLCSIFFLLGYFSRLSALLLFAFYAYITALDTLYFSFTDMVYLSIIGLMAVFPTSKNYSLDSLRIPNFRTLMIRCWHYNILWGLLIFFCGIEYFAFIKNVFLAENTPSSLISTIGSTSTTKIFFKYFVFILNILFFFFLIIKNFNKALIVFQTLQCIYVTYIDELFGLLFLFMLAFSLYTKKLHIIILGYLKNNIPMQVYFKQLVNRFSGTFLEKLPQSFLYNLFGALSILALLVFTELFVPSLGEHGGNEKKSNLGGFHNTLFLRQTAEKSMKIFDLSSNQEADVIISEFLGDSRNNGLTNQTKYYQKFLEHLKSHFQSERIDSLAITTTVHLYTENFNTFDTLFYSLNPDGLLKKEAYP